MARNFTAREFGPMVNKFATEDLNRAVREAGDEVLDWTVKFIKRSYFRSSGKPSASYIVSRTGHLKSTVRRKKMRKMTNLPFLAGSVMMGDATTPQARILEFGGRTRPHMIFPVKASMLSFFWPKAGKQMFLPSVKHPGSVFEPRAVLGRGMAHAEPRFLSGMRKAIDRAATKRLG